MYLITTHNGYIKEDGTVIPRVEIEDYPSIKHWLESEEWNDKPDKGSSIKRLQTRTDKGDTFYNLRDCAYMDDFNRQKIIYGQFRQGEFCLDNDKMMLSSNEYMLVCAKHNLTSLLNYLNSPLCYFYQKCTMNTLGGNTTIAQKSIFIEIPVPQIDDYNACFEDFCKEIELSDEEISFIKNSL